MNTTLENAALKFTNAQSPRLPQSTLLVSEEELFGSRLSALTGAVLTDAQKQDLQKQKSSKRL